MIDNTSFAEYLEKCSDENRKVLNHLFELVRNSYEVSAKMSYGMPCFYYKGKYFVGFGSFSKHMSMFPGSLPAKFATKLKNYDTTKGSIHFSDELPISDDFVTEILDYRKKEIEQLG